MSQLEDVMKMLDSMTEAGVGRIKVEVSEAVEEGCPERLTITGDVMWEAPLRRGSFLIWKKRIPGVSDKYEEPCTPSPLWTIYVL